MLGSRRAFTSALAAAAFVVASGGMAQQAFAQGKDVVILAAASLKNALDEASADWTQEDRQDHQNLLCRELGAGQADRGRHSGRHLHLGRRAVDGLCRGAQAHQAGQPLGLSRQPDRPDRRARTPRSISRSTRASTCAAHWAMTAVSRWAASTPCRPASTARRRWSISASGRRSSTAWRRPRTSAWR